MLTKTVKAVKAFQTDHGLKANGGVTQDLIDLMAHEALKLNSPDTTPEFTPAPAETQGT